MTSSNSRRFPQRRGERCDGVGGGGGGRGGRGGERETDAGSIGER